MSGGLRAGLWAGLLVAGQAALLRLVEAGPAVRYQHLPPPARIIAEHPALLVALLAYWLIVVIGVWRAALRPRSWFSTGTLVFLTLAGLATSAALSRALRDYATESVLLFVAQVAALCNAILVGQSLTVPAAERLGAASGGWLGDDDATRGGAIFDRWALVPALAVLGASVALAWLSYQRHPHIPDEVAYFIQAKYLAHGRLWMSAPPVPAGFELDLMEMDAARWYSALPPGWPAMLALGFLVRAPWLVNPVLGAVNVLLAYALLRELHGRRTARMGTLLLALSPWHTFLAMSYMSHTFSLSLALLAALGVARCWRGASSLWCLAGGAAVGVASVNRPLEGVALAASLGVLSLYARGRRFRFGPSVALALGTTLAGLSGLWYNLAMTGRALTFPVDAYFRRVYGPGRYEIGFGPTRGLGWTGLDPLPGHGPIDVAINSALNASAVNVELFGWAAGSLGIVLIALAVRRPRGADLAMLFVVLAVLTAHAFFWFSGGPDFGARYWFLTIVPAVALAARGLRWLEGDEVARRGRVLAAAAALSAGTLVVFYPWRAADKYYHYRQMAPEGPRAAAAAGGRLVLVRGRSFPDYASAAVYNPVDARDLSSTVLAWDRGGATRRALLAAYPGRPVWMLDGPTRTGGAWTLTGPFPPAHLPASADSSRTETR